MSDQQLPAFGSIKIGTVNWYGVWTLYGKEVWRFCKVLGQTVLAPVVTTFLFMTIFTLALGGGTRVSGDISYPLFLAPGLIIMSVLQNAFANPSSSLMSAKMQGNIVDILLAPLGPGEIAVAYMLGGVTRGLLVGVILTLAMFLFVRLPFSHVWAMLYFGIGTAMLLSLLGIIAGIWAEKFEQSAAINNFIIVPLSFLSGTFYSIDRLPGIWHDLSHINPFFYMIDGFRYGMIGRADADPLIGMLYLAGLNLFLWIVTYRMLKSGYNLRP
ncbi:ABC transporter permease [Luteithermobacter gelatinilyticus]|uniref:ABC transporter permease n=1 Tax=Luteithermobacter gelatinilyticus TaxID=2582913 RepID=UPI0011075B04|nr:ABC transporter permease [Luteithermobacter gelatinilyticus]